MNEVPKKEMGKKKKKRHLKTTEGKAVSQLNEFGFFPLKILHKNHDELMRYSRKTAEKTQFYSLSSVVFFLKIKFALINY